MGLTVGCSGLLSLCLSLLPGLPCSAPALAVEASLPSRRCSPLTQLTALGPLLQGDTEGGTDGGREGDGGGGGAERHEFKNGAARKLLMHKYERRSAQSSRREPLTSARADRPGSWWWGGGSLFLAVRDLCWDFYLFGFFFFKSHICCITKFGRGRDRGWLVFRSCISEVTY